MVERDSLAKFALPGADNIANLEIPYHVGSSYADKIKSLHYIAAEKRRNYEVFKLFRKVQIFKDSKIISYRPAVATFATVLKILKKHFYYIAVEKRSNMSCRKEKYLKRFRIQLNAECTSKPAYHCCAKPLHFYKISKSILTGNGQKPCHITQKQA